MDALKTALKRILFVEEDRVHLRNIQRVFVKDNFELLVAFNTTEAIDIFVNQSPEIVVAGFASMNVNGLELCRTIRARHDINQPLIVILSPSNDEFAQLAAFDAGADCYCPEPVKPLILHAQIKALLRVQSGFDSEESLITIRDISIHLKNKTMLKNGKEIQLRKKEFDMLVLLASNPGKIYSRSEIYREVWQEQSDFSNRTLDVHVRRLRAKMGKDYIRTMKGLGYGLVNS